MTGNIDARFDRVYGVFGVRQQPGSGKGEYFSDIKIVEEYLEGLYGWHQGNLKIISGGSHGVEMIAEEWALRKGVEFERVKPLMHENHIAPFDIRNERIIGKSDDIVVFWDAEDVQIGRTLRMAVKAGRGIKIIPIVYE